MSWKNEVAELRRRRKLAEQMGGQEKVARQHARGKLDARARIKGLVDPGSFREIGKIAGKGSYGPDGELLDLAPSNLVFGRANIEGRPVVASADDFTVRGGAPTRRSTASSWPAEQMAHTLKIPLIRMIDGTGGGGSVKDAGGNRRDLCARHARLGRDREEPGNGAGGRAGAGANRGTGRGAGGGQPLFDHGQGPQPAVRRRARRGRGDRRGERQGIARRLDHPHPQRCGRRGSGIGGRGLCPRPPVPVLPAQPRRPARPSPGLGRPRRPPRSGAGRSRPARGQAGLFDAQADGHGVR
jgi:hypothetical protein